MQKFVTILLVLGLGFHSLTKLSIVAWYEINKDYIAATLCENKNKPEMHCNGKCYLNKQLKKADKTSGQKDTPDTIKKIEEPEFITSVDWQIIAHQIFPETLKHFVHYCYPTGYSPAEEIFHPPVVV